jgi:hypothetical protein
LPDAPLSELGLVRLKKTSIDYALCAKTDELILCVAFDGIQQGISVGTEYHPDARRLASYSPWRKNITKLKLRVVLGSLFLYFVVGSNQFDDLTPSVELTIVDGIIGRVLANKACSERIGEGFRPGEHGYTQEESDSLSAAKQQDIVQEWALGVEVETDMENNPAATVAPRHGRRHHQRHPDHRSLHRRPAVFRPGRCHEWH